MFSLIVNVFVTFEIAISLKGSRHLFPVELAIYYARFSGSFMFFLSIIGQRTGLLFKEEIFVVNIPLARSFTVFTYKPSYAWVILEI